MKNGSLQQGMSLIGFMLIMMCIVVVMLVAMRMVPVYNDALAIRSMLSTLESRSFKEASEIKRYLQNNLKINNIENIQPDAFKIKLSDTRYFEITTDIFLTRPMYGNWSVQYHINESVKSKRTL